VCRQTLPKPTSPPASTRSGQSGHARGRLRRAHVGMFLPTFLAGSFCRHFPTARQLRHAVANRVTLRGRLGRAPKPIGPPAPSTAANRATLCWRLRRAHVGMFLPTFSGRHFWPAVFRRPFSAGIFAHRAHKGPVNFLASVSPFERGKGGCRQTLLRGTPKGET
jgi:hypothetical protein